MDAAVQMSDVMVWRREPVQGGGRGGREEWGF